MDKPLRVLHLEDDTDFADLVNELLDRAGLCPHGLTVSDMASFLAALEREPWDIILADYSLPSCTGLDALREARDRRPEIPFLVVSGTIGEEAAIESVKQGATDYVLKNWLERLVPAMRRAVHEAQERAQRKRAEAEVAQQARYLRALTQNSLDVLTILSRDGSFQYASGSLRHVVGYEPEELAGRNAFEFVHPEDLPGALRAFEQALKNPELRVTYEFRYRRKDGSWCHLEVVGQNRSNDPEIAGIVLNARDITERKQVEARLRLQSAALESTANAIVITDRAGAVIWANPAFTRLTGYSADEIQGQNPRLLKSGQHDEAYYKGLWDTILAGRVWHAEIVNRRKDGSLYTEDATITPVRDERDQITHFIAIKQDITERRQLEAQLRQAQKMEAVGQLAGGVAHDFNNLLTVIRGNADLALADGRLVSEKARRCLKQVTAAADRAASLVRQLLTFSRKQVMHARPLNLNEVIRELTKMLNRIIGENIHLQCSYDTRLPFIEADAGMIEQVLVNLVVNARDAMPNGGQLVITTETAIIGETYVRSHPEARAGEFARLSVQDTGEGIAPEHLPRIFEPFFTTKELGKGTGLGLATAYGIIKQHQGWAEVFSRLGEGTIFKVFLPAIAKPASSAAPESVEPIPRGGTEGILVVEDDVAVRMLTRQILESAGYRVWEASCAREALTVWQDHAGDIALLLTDIVMPDRVTGLALAEQLRAQQARLKIIVMSGYSADLADKDGPNSQGNKHCFLQKPYSPDVLLRAVRDCLDAPKQRPHAKGAKHTRAGSASLPT